MLPTGIGQESAHDEAGLTGPHHDRLDGAATPRALGASPGDTIGPGYTVGERCHGLGRQLRPLVQQLLETPGVHGVAERGPRLGAIRARVGKQARSATRGIRGAEEACG